MRFAVIYTKIVWKYTKKVIKNITIFVLYYKKGVIFAMRLCKLRGKYNVFIENVLKIFSKFR